MSHGDTEAQSFYLRVSVPLCEISFKGTYYGFFAPDMLTYGVAVGVAGVGMGIISPVFSKMRLLVVVSDSFTGRGVNGFSLSIFSIMPIT